MRHFSERYFEENQNVFPSVDTIHGIVCAMLLLNADLHGNVSVNYIQLYIVKLIW